MHTKKRIKLAFGIVLGFHVQALAGTEPQVEATPAAPSSFDWCEWLQGKPGTLYKNKENPYLQEVQIGGRFHYQAAYLHGNDVNGRDYHATHDEVRRFRLESKVDFLQYFSSKVYLNMVSDDRRSGGDLDWGYEDFDEAVFSFDAGKAFGTGPLDSLKLNYGRFKFNMTEEVHMSSRRIYTIERSAIANKLYGANNRPTGVTLDAAIGKWSATAGVFSSEDDSDFIGGWNGGQACYLSLEHATSDDWRFVVDSVVNNPNGNGDDFLGYDWATAINAIHSQNRYGALGTIAFGENNEGGDRGGSFYAMMLMPYYWVLEDRLQAVVQYQYAGSSKGEGIRTNSRYVRSENPSGINVNSGRGDELHTLYAGLNYHFCGDNLKVMGGVEYTNLETPAGNVDALSWLVGVRTFF